MNRIYDILLFSRWLVGWQSRLSFIITLNKQDEKSTWCDYLKVFCNMFMLSFHAKSSCYAFYYCTMFCNISMSFQCTYKVYSINVKCFAKFSLFALTLLGRGRAESAHTLFRWLFLHEKRGLEVQNFVTFPYSLWTFRKSNFFLFFTVIFGV